MAINVTEKTTTVVSPPTFPYLGVYKKNETIVAIVTSEWKQVVVKVGDSGFTVGYGLDFHHGAFYPYTGTLNLSNG